MKKCWNYLKELSIFSIQFGVFIDKTTRYVNLPTIVFSWMFKLLSFVITIYCLEDVNKISSCCYSYTDEDNKEKSTNINIYEKYNIRKP